MKIDCAYEDISPETAARYLEANRCNRPVKLKTVDMRAGHWMITHRCQWLISGKPEDEQCHAAAEWKGPSCVQDAWYLCDHHKTILIASFNAATQAAEEPRWTMRGAIQYEQ